MTRPVCLILCLSLCSGCPSKEDNANEATPVHSAPWRRDAPIASANVSKLEYRFRVAPPGRAAFVLKTRLATIEGQLSVIKGEISFDPMVLSKTTGQLSFDLGSVRFPGVGETDQIQHEASAQNWLNLGASRPEAERERLRWAKFRIERVEGLDAEDAHSGAARKLKGDVSADAGAASEAGAQEARRVQGNLHGTLEFNDHRVEHEVAVNVDFLYPVAATPGAKPSRIKVTSRRDVEVPLASHNIVPRDSHGVEQPAELKLLGVSVGRIARVSFELELLPVTQGDDE